MVDPTRAAYESALHKLKEGSERLATGKENDTAICTASQIPHRILPLLHARYMQRPAKKISCAAGNLFRGHGWERVWHRANIHPAGPVYADSTRR